MGEFNLLNYMMDLSGEIREIRGEIEKLYEISGITYSDLPRVSKIKDLSHVIAAIEKLKGEERAKINEYVRVRAFALEVVLKIKNPTYRQIIILKYFDEKDWEAIALDMGYSVKHAQKVHRYALKDMDLKLAPKCSEMLQIAPECSSKM